MTTLASALSNASSVMGQTGSQYLSREFVISSDEKQKATLEDLVTDLQKIFHRCKKEADRVNTAKKILATLGCIASLQGSPEEKAHFAKIKEVAMQALATETNTVVSRAEDFQSKLILLLFAKKSLVSHGITARTGLSYEEAETKSSSAFKKIIPLAPDKNRKDRELCTYCTLDEGLSTLAISKFFRINSLCMLVVNPRSRPLTAEELLELESYCQHEEPQIKKIADDYTLLRKRTAALRHYNKSIRDENSLWELGCQNNLVILKSGHFEPSQTLSAYYPAFDKYMYGQSPNPNTTLQTEDCSSKEPIAMNSLYEEHLTQLPAVHFAYRYFYTELNEVCSLFPTRVAASGYKKAYKGYEGNVLPAPDDFQLIEAVLPDLKTLQTAAVEKEKKESPSKSRPASSNKSSSKQSMTAKSKKQSHPKPPSSKPTESKNVPTPTSSTTSSSTTSAAKEKGMTKQTLKKDALPFDEIVYDPRVSLWFTNPQDCLALPSYASLSENGQKIAVYKHAFPIVLDELVGTAYSIQETYQNTKQNQVDTLFSIPGEIESISSAKKVRGIFQYCFGANDKVCYHRHFKEMSTSELLQTEEYGKTFEEVEFPPLASQSAPAPAKNNTPDQELVHEPLLNSYAVKDVKQGLIFRAFKIR